MAGFVRCSALRPFVHGPIDPPVGFAEFMGPPLWHPSSNALPVVLEEGIRSLIGTPKVHVVDGELILGAAWLDVRRTRRGYEACSRTFAVSQDSPSTRASKSIIETDRGAP